MNNLKYSLLIVFAAFIWGSAFVAQSIGMDYIGPFTFNSIRFIIGGIVLLPVIMIMERLKKKTGREPSETLPFKSYLQGGMICGTILCIASSLQQYGIQFTTAGKSGFITALYVIFVPLFGLFLHKRPTWIMWLGAVLSVAGMYMLCVSETMTINFGDLLTLICAVFFACHIISIGHFAHKLDGILLSCIQFFTAGIISGLVALFTETADPGNIISASLPILYAGVLSCGVAYTLQAVAESKVDPVLCSILFSLESVFSVLTAWIVLGEKLTLNEITGCILVFAAVLIVQLAPNKNSGRN